MRFKCGRRDKKYFDYALEFFGLLTQKFGLLGLQLFLEALQPEESKKNGMALQPSKS
jgi:hypothetical protein